MKVMVPLDDMPYSYAALESIIQRDWPGDTKFILTRVVENRDTSTNPATIYNPEEHLDALHREKDHHINKAKNWLKSLSNALRSNGKVVESQILIGDITQSLCSFAKSWNADFIIMGSHDRNQQERTWLGSIGADVAQCADCSVELVRPTNMHNILLDEDFNLNSVSKLDFSPRKILVPLDLSENSIEAIHWICKVNGLENTSVSIINVVKPKGHGAITKQIGQTLDGTQPVESEKIIQLTQQRDFLALNAKIYSVGVKVLKGEPIQSILEFAEQWQADSIVLATRGETNQNKPVIGSIARGLMDGAHCSIMAIKPNTSARVSYKWIQKNVSTTKQLK